MSWWFVFVCVGWICVGYFGFMTDCLEVCVDFD